MAWFEQVMLRPLTRRSNCCAQARVDACYPYRYKIFYKGVADNPIGGSILTHPSADVKLIPLFPAVQSWRSSGGNVLDALQLDG